MRYTCQLLCGSEPAIDLEFNPTGGYSLLQRGFQPNDPEQVTLWGGRLETELVRDEYGKRVIPLRLILFGSSIDDLIARVNGLQERLTQAARYRYDGWGSEVFLLFQITGSTYAIRYPVLKGSIDKGRLLETCNDLTILDGIDVEIVCETYWEADATYSLENWVDNPGWWRGAAPGDSWTEVNGADVTSTIDTTIYEVMGKSLKQVYIVDAVNDTGVRGDAITVTASTAYYFEVRNYRVAACDVLTAQIYDITNAAIIGVSVLTFNGATGAWIKQGVTFNTPVGCVSIRVELFCLAASSVAGGTAYWDAVYIDDSATAPVGWCSSRNLMNHMDADADHLNVLCVTEIPGEVEAEAKIGMDLTQVIWTMRNAKRTRDDPHNMIWQLLPRDAYTTADAFFGLTHASCIDSSKAVDANAPGGYRIEVSFAGVQTMQPRCYWNVAANLASYYGKWQLVLLVSKSANTDDVFMKVQAYNPSLSHSEGYILQQEAQQATANYWCTLDGWEIFSFPIGAHDNDLWGAGDRWQIRLYASITGAAAWDTLRIAGVYLVPLDEAYMIAGNPSTQFAAGTDFSIDNLDANKGVFPYNTGTDTHYNNMGYIGQLPTLTPKIENWLYFVLGQTFGTGEVLITDPAVVSVTYRPRGKFLRAANP